MEEYQTKLFAYSTMEAIWATNEASKEAVLYHKFLNALKDIPSMDRSLTLYCVNMVDILNTKDSRYHMRRSTLMGSIK